MGWELQRQLIILIVDSLHWREKRHVGFPINIILDDAAALIPLLLELSFHT
jgi:hypothetical protein